MITLEKFMSELKGENINEIVAAGSSASSMSGESSVSSESSLSSVSSESSSSS
ncbi:hypothetical protein [Cyclobacterium sp. SYSU L10401]|uniref:hypothetical protein n=1 Tax=Cyclobacterium sp. SYSU L10401 TaxID=2678657 RepID=UPI0013D75B7E|nr:hypothetical protein [Cyclobacterium sp. SYSU L10401]